MTNSQEEMLTKEWLDSKNISYTLSADDNLTVGGSLYLQGAQITKLPDNLTVGGSLDQRGTQITKLPDGLTVARLPLPARRSDCAKGIKTSCS